MKKILPVLFFIALLRAADVPRPIGGQSLQKTSVQEWKFFDVNSIFCTINNAGPFADYQRTNSSGLFWPKGSSKTSVYTAGLWIIGKHRPSDSLRTAVMSYSTEYQPGPILTTFNTETNSITSVSNPSDPRYRIYKVRSVDDEHNMDYRDWPGDLGAPYTDLNGNNQWDSGIDIPKITGDQMLWCVFNDGNYGIHNYTGKTKPMGIEVQASYFGYGNYSPLKNVMFMKFVIINKSDADYDSVFISLWSDTDLGDANDDCAGYDSTLKLSFVYNGDDNDNGSSGYGNTPPAGGFTLIQGPLIPGTTVDTGIVGGQKITGRKNLDVTSHIVYYGGGGIAGWDDPPIGNAIFASEAYRYQRGLIGSTGLPYVDPITQQPSTFVFSGDPVTGTGWQQTHSQPPTDVRSMISTGPFTFAQGDTQEIIAAYIIEQGNDRLKSITLLRETTAFARTVANAGFIFPAIHSNAIFSDDSVALQLSADARHYNASSISVDIKKQETDSLLVSRQLFDNGSNGDTVAGDGVFSGIFYFPISTDPIRIDAHITDQSLSVFHWPSLVEGQPLSRLRATSPVIFSDDRNSDGRIQPGENIRYGVTVTNEVQLPFDNVTVRRRPHGYTNLSLGQMPPLGTISTTYENGANRNYLEFSVPTHYNETTITEYLRITDEKGNVWLDSVFLPIDYGNERLSLTQKVSGRSPFSIDVVVTDKKRVTNNTYSVTGVDSGGFVIGIQIRDSTERRSVGEIIRFSGTSITDNNHRIPETEGFKVNLNAVQWFSQIQYSWQPIYGQSFSSQIYPAGGGYTLYPNTSVSLGDVPNIEIQFSKVETVAVDASYGRLERNSKTYWFPIQGNSRTQRAYLYSHSAYLGFINIPFTVYDMTSNPPRQLTVVIRRWSTTSDSKFWIINSDRFYVMEDSYSAHGEQYDSTKGGINLLSQWNFYGRIPFYYSISLTPHLQPFMDTLDLQILCTPALSYRDIITFIPAEYSIVSKEIPTQTMLLQNYPNPFNPSTIIQYSVHRNMHITIDVYDILGRRVRTLLNEYRTAGTYEINWNGRDDNNIPVSSGLYLYRFSSEGTNIVKRMMLIK